MKKPKTTLKLPTPWGWATLNRKQRQRWAIAEVMTIARELARADFNMREVKDEDGHARAVILQEVRP